LPEFTVICEERYNQIRNASHHGMTMERKTQTIHYRTRKGGTGPKQKIRYATYLARSAKLFLQALPLPVIEGRWCGVTATVSAFQHAIGRTARLWIDRVAGTILAIFGVRELYRAL
jgi:hypothetical protein